MSKTPKVLVYYQTLTSLKPILIKNSPVTDIHLSSIHFGVDKNNKPYIHLNNESPYSSTFDTVWKELASAQKLGINIRLMIGGAGGGYSSLFSNFEVYYSLLSELLRNKSIISGVDLDIEEECSLDDVKMLIRSIKEEFGNNLTLSMAPIQSSLESDGPGMGGWSYKKLIQSPEGKCIDFFNVQFYSDFSYNAYQNIIKNGYLPEMVVMGAMAGEKNDTEIEKCVRAYSRNFGGVYVWEYCFAKPSPLDWAKNVSNMVRC
jgi:hypothetical protein